MSSQVYKPDGAVAKRITGFDELGRCRFLIEWVDSRGNIRAQVFFANPKNYGFEL